MRKPKEKTAAEKIEELKNQPSSDETLSDLSDSDD